ncbi:MAG: response regulator transcription factor [Alphaproteobacteria bacterium]|nr:response regulator transcription factor [Alphaproteobacteria bacterium]
MDEPHILVVDDDQRLRELLRGYLSRNGFRVTLAGDAAEARQSMTAMQFDLMVLDVMMPGESGLEFASALRAKDRALPILMLTAMNEPRDRVAGLESGVDDYLAKPFEPRELVLRLQALLRRAEQRRAPPPVESVTLGGMRFDLGRGELLRESGERIRLTEAEVVLLRALAARDGDPVDREALARELGGDVNARTIDVHVTRLRRKIEPDPRFPRYLLTARGAGYRLVGE